MPFMMYYVYKLASNLRVFAPVIWVLGMFIPCINLILLLYLSSRAYHVLKGAGFRVGLMGANLEEIERRMEGM